MIVVVSLNAVEKINDFNESLQETIATIENQLVNSTQNQPVNTIDGIDDWIDNSGLKWSNSSIGDFKNQKLSFEVKLKNQTQILAEQRILNLGQQKIELKLLGVLESRLKTKYFSFIDFLEKRKQKKFFQQQQALTHSELENWKLKVNTDSFRADKLQQVSLTLDSIWADELNNNSTLARFNTQQNFSADSRFFYNIITIPQVLDITQNILKERTYQKFNNMVRKAELAENLTYLEKRRKTSQGDFAVNSVKLEYDNKNNDLGLSIGMSVPITKNSFEQKLEKQKYQYAKIESHLSISNVEEQLRKKRFEIMNYYDQWLSNQKLLHKINTRIYRLSKTKYISLLLELKQERLKRSRQKEALKVNVLREYINYLSIAGMLSAKPYRNWLQAGTPVIM